MALEGTLAVAMVVRWHCRADWWLRGSGDSGLMVVEVEE